MQLCTIEAQALPLVLMRRDVIGLAQTGSGKTLAFLVPIAVRLGKAQEKGKLDVGGKQDPLALVLAPTRELAVQISMEADKMFQAPGKWGVPQWKVACVYGGGDKATQISMEAD